MSTHTSASIASNAPVLMRALVHASRMRMSLEKSFDDRAALAAADVDKLVAELFDMLHMDVVTCPCCLAANGAVCKVQEGFNDPMVIVAGSAFPMHALRAERLGLYMRPLMPVGLRTR